MLIKWSGLQGGEEFYVILLLVILNVTDLLIPVRNSEVFL